MMYKRVVFLVFASFLLLCSCEHLFESNKEKLDRLVGTYWDKWKSDGKDTAMCVVDFAEVVPIDWDTMVYIDYDRYYDSNKKGLADYMERYWVENEDSRGYPEDGLHFWENGRLVYEISLWMASEDEKGVFFCTKNQFIVRGRNDARFHVKKKGRFYIVRDLSEGFIHTWRYVKD